jgi:hypothetical protein
MTKTVAASAIPTAARETERERERQMPVCHAIRLLISLFQCVCVCVCAIIWVAGIARWSRPHLAPGTAAVFGPRANGWKAGMEEEEFVGI